VKSPWKSIKVLQHDHEYVVLASSIPPLSRSSTRRLFGGASPHQELMVKLSPEMGPTKFVRWTIKGSNGRPSWREALQRLN